MGVRELSVDEEVIPLGPAVTPTARKPRIRPLDAGDELVPLEQPKYGTATPDPYEPSLGEMIFGSDVEDQQVTGILPSVGETLFGRAPAKEVATRFLPNTAESIGAMTTEAVAGGQLASIDNEIEILRRELRPPHAGGNRYPERRAELEARLQDAEERRSLAMGVGHEARAGGAEAIPSDAGLLESGLQQGASTAAVVVPAAMATGGAGGAVVLGAGTGAQRYGQLIEQGVDEEAAARSAVLIGSLETLTEYLPAKTLLKKAPGFDALKGKLAEFFASELPGENINTIAQMVDDYANGLRDDLTTDDFLDAFADTTLNTVLGGAVQVGAVQVLQQVADQANASAESRGPATPELGDQLQALESGVGGLGSSLPALPAPGPLEVSPAGDVATAAQHDAARAEERELADMLGLSDDIVSNLARLEERKQQALADRQGDQVPALPSPATLVVDEEGRAGPVGSHGVARAAIEELAAQRLAEKEALGLTPDIEANLGRLAERAAAEASQPLALPSPDTTVYVDEAGRAGTPVQQDQYRRQGNAELEAAASEAEALGLTADVAAAAAQREAGAPTAQLGDLLAGATPGAAQAPGAVRPFKSADGFVPLESAIGDTLAPALPAAERLAAVPSSTAAAEGEGAGSATVGASLQAEKINTPAPAKAGPTALQFLASKGGLNIEALEAEGIDRADMRSVRGFKRPFTKKGMTLDAAAELLHEAGYDVGDGQGGYSANRALELIDNELRGKPSYAAGSAVPQAEEVDRRREETRTGDERRGPPPRETPERRVGDRRARLGEMSREELMRELTTSKLTGLPNKRAYEERERLPVQASLDVDSLKWVNDNMGHESGDQLLAAVGEAIRGATDNGFHFSGDEFVIEGATESEIRAVMEEVEERLAKATIEITKSDGTVVTLEGMGVSYGTGDTLAQADENLGRSKTTREAQGVRAARGEQPAGASIRRGRDEGRSDHEGDARSETDDDVALNETAELARTRAGAIVDGLTVGSSIPNRSSIGASLTDYESLGLRVVPLSEFTAVNYAAADDKKRVKTLAAEIESNERIDPLIVVQDAKGYYVLEGGHRLAALQQLGKKELPALVVRDLDEDVALEEQRDLFGKNQTAQDLADRQREKDSKRSPNRDVDADTGAPGDLFTRPRQVDIEDVAKPKRASASRELVPAGQQMYVQYGGKRFPVDTLNEAKAKWNEFRDSTGAGASELGQALIVDENGVTRGYISYNGKIWEGKPTDWKPGDKPLLAAERRAAPRGWESAETMAEKVEPAVVDDMRLAVEAMFGDAKNAPTVEFVAGAKELPPQIARRIQESPGMTWAALFDPKSGRVFINYEQTRSVGAAVWNAAHEIDGHLGLRGFIGKGAPDARKKLDAALTIATQNPFINELAQAIGDRRKALNFTQATEEALAELAGARSLDAWKTLESRYGVKAPASVRKKAMNALERFLERLKHLIAKFMGAKFTDQQVRELLEGASRYVREGTTSTSTRDRAQLTEGIDFKDELKKLAADIKERHGLGMFDVYEMRNGDISVAGLAVRNKDQKQGRGTAAMRELADFADSRGRRIILEPATKSEKPGEYYTTSQRRLIRFYQRLGFVRNKGRNRDFTIAAQAMYREPQAATDTPEFEEWFGDSKVVDERGKPLRVFHGTGRLDRMQGGLKKERATSGPMPYFTADPEIASNYAKGKQDTSVDEESYVDWFKYMDGTTERPVTDLWNEMTPAQRVAFNKALPAIREDEDADALIVDPDGQGMAVKGTYEQYLRESRGNGIKAAIELWLGSAALFNEEHKFMDVLELAGVDTSVVEFRDLKEGMPGVLSAYLKIEKPLVTSKIPRRVVQALERAADEAPAPKTQYGADPWDKNLRDPQAWIDELREGMKEGGNTGFVWTSIPDFVTKTLEELGYDGIHDVGGKMGGEQHDVWVPFEPTQVRNAIDPSVQLNEEPTETIYAIELVEKVKKDGVTRLERNMLADGPFDTREEAERFLRNEVGAPGARVVATTERHFNQRMQSEYGEDYVLAGDDITLEGDTVKTRKLRGEDITLETPAKEASESDVDDALTKDDTAPAREKLLEQIEEAALDVRRFAKLSARELDRYQHEAESAVADWEALRERYEEMFGEKPPVSVPEIEEGDAPLLHTVDRRKGQRRQSARARGGRRATDRGPSAKKQKGYAAAAQRAIDAFNHKIGWRYGALGKLPGMRSYLKERYESLGRIGKSQAVARSVFNAFKSATPAQAKEIYDYLTHKGALASTIKDPKQRNDAIQTKNLIDAVGKRLVEEGMLSRDAYDAHAGEYLPRVYLKHLLGDRAVRAIGSGKTTSDQGYLKQRLSEEQLPKEVRDVILGEITDPAFLASFSLGRTLRDLALIDFFKTIAGNDQWVPKGATVEFNGRNVSPFWLEAEAKQLRRRAELYAPATATKARAVADKMEAAAAKAAAELGDVDLSDYRQIPDSKRYGMLRGLWVRREIYNDLVGQQAAPGRDGIAERVLGENGILTGLSRAFKVSKVVLNPPSQVRNFVSNLMLLQLSGVPARRIPILIGKAIRSLVRKDRYFDIYEQFGGTAATWQASEVKQISEEWIRLKELEKNPLARVMALGAAAVNKASNAYGVLEGIGKIAKLIDAMDREGMSPADAMLAAHEALFDYSLVHPNVRYLRNNPLGAPFITFQYKVLPQLARTAVKHPLRYAPYVLLPYLLLELFKHLHDVDDDDVDKLKRAFPDWMNERGQMLLLPYKDELGRWQVADMGYLVPWGVPADLYATAKADPGKAAKNALQQVALGGPLTDVAAAIETNVDPFTGNEIVNPQDPPADKIASMLLYAWNLAMPGFLTERGAIPQTVRAAQGNVNRRGERGQTLGQAMLRMFGINVYPVDPEKTRAANIRAMEYGLEERRARAAELLRDRNLTEKQRTEIRETWRKILADDAAAIKAYRDASEIHPNLRTGDADETPAE